MVVHLFYFCFEPLKRRFGVGAFPHRHDSLHDVIVVDDLSIFAANRTGELAEPDFGTLRNHGNIFNADRRSGLGQDDRVFDIVDVSDQADFTDIDLLQSAFDKAATGVRVVISKLLLDLGEAEAVSDELIRINLNLILARGPAEGVHVDDVRYGF